jgi:hypothetical protein
MIITNCIYENHNVGFNARVGEDISVLFELIFA